MLPVPASSSACPPSTVSDNLLELFLHQLSWLVAGGHDAKRAFTVWLLASPPPPSGTAAVLSQARRITARHLAQLELLLSAWSLPAAAAAPSALRGLFATGDDSSRPAPAIGQRAEQLATIQRVSGCFGPACASAAETAMVLGRVDIAVVLASWAAAWRDLQAMATPGPAGVPCGGW
jgi:hypothetical protein